MSLSRFLAASAEIDWHDDSVARLAEQLGGTSEDRLAVAKRCFEWVRDQVEHCVDFNRDEVPCSASQVLRVGTGFCYAKSHLLAALLRANRIPTGFCYQRLSLEGAPGPFCLHGLNAIHLAKLGWYRIDPRGNKPGLISSFSPPTERLPFRAELPGEADLPEVWPEPLPIVVTALRSHQSASELQTNLPDLPLLNLPSTPASRQTDTIE